MGLGGLLLAYALFGLFRAGALDYLSLLPPLGLIAGGALSSVGLAALHGRPRGRRPLDRGWARAPFVVAGVGLGLLGLFWAANDYAHLQGHERGLDLQSRVDLLPQITVYSRSSLHTTSDQVTEQALTAPDGERMYRYEGFRLLIRSAGKYFLLPVEPAGRQPVTVLPEEEIGWIEFTP